MTRRSAVSVNPSQLESLTDDELFTALAGRYDGTQYAGKTAEVVARALINSGTRQELVSYLSHRN